MNVLTSSPSEPGMASPAPTTPPPEAPLLQVRDLVKHFPIRKGFFSSVSGHVYAVDGVSFDVRRGQTFSLVGESGCGKTTTGRALLRLVEPTSGTVIFDGQDVLALDGAELRETRAAMQIIFQDPYSSLNPRMTVGSIIEEGLLIHGMKDRDERHAVLANLLDTVGLAPEHATRYPHEFSGGQRQRVGIARALALEPKFIVCDEAVSALDVSIQAQIINLLQDLQNRYGIAYLFIAHDLAVVRHISHRVGVMYLGNLMEEADVETLFANPQHPYTQALLSAIPDIEPTRRRKRHILQGDVPQADNPPPGCRFHTRCPHCTIRCRSGTIPVVETEPGHRVKCILFEGKGTPVSA